MAIATEPRKAIRKAIYKKLADGICLRCDKPANPKCRGLCKQHWNVFYRSICSLGEAARIRKISKMILNGEVYRSRQGQRITKQKGAA
jgi:hypothetical protein